VVKEPATKMSSAAGHTLREAEELINGTPADT
jgi:hypothetical protein